MFRKFLALCVLGKPLLNFSGLFSYTNLVPANVKNVHETLPSIKNKIMKKILLFLAILFLVGIESTKANNPKHSTLIKMESPADSSRLVALDLYWASLAQTA